MARADEPFTLGRALSSYTVGEIRCLLDVFDYLREWNREKHMVWFTPAGLRTANADEERHRESLAVSGEPTMQRLIACLLSGAVILADHSSAFVQRGLSRQLADEMLRAHNAWRRKVGVLYLRWAPDLAVMAQRRAERLAKDGCQMEHHLLPDDIGENLYRAAPLRAEGREDLVNPVTPTQVVDEWGAEERSYDYASNRCAPGKQCGHYTQLIWAESDEVGCGMAICASRGQVWACDYRPNGNIMGKRPY